MNSIAKSEKNFKSNGAKSQIKSILKILIAFNKDKTSSKIKYICVSQVESLIVKMLKRYKRLLKIYWTISTKNKNYRQSGGIEKYSARDIYNMVSKILENDSQKKVCKRTIERDIKLLNEIGLLQSKIRRLGEYKGSISHYRQHMKLAYLHKDIILEYLIHLLKESLNDKKIIGDFDDLLEDATFNYTNLEKFEIPSNLSEHNKITVMSHVQKSHVINKANISYVNKKNSDEVLSKKTVPSNKKTRQYKFKRKDVETRLVSIQKVSKKYLKQVKELSNNDATYINALINLETAIIEYKNEYNIEDILEHFLKQFSNKYRHKIWMMMRRKDGVISDYGLIWEGRFRDWYPNKYKFNYVVKENYGGNIRVGNKSLNTQARKQILDNLQHNQCNETGKIEKERAKEKRRLELKLREEYLNRLFENEAQEMQERLRKARGGAQEYLREQTKKRDMIAILKKDRTTSTSMVSDSNLIGLNRGLNVRHNNNPPADYQLRPEGICKPSEPAVVCPGISLKVNYEGFKTTKGMEMSLASLGINVSPNQKEDTIKEKEEGI